MLERYNPILRIVCLALVGLILYQVSRLAFKRDAIAVSRLETPVLALDTTNRAKVETNSPAQTNSVANTNAPASATNSAAAKTASMRPPRSGPGGAPKLNVPADVQAILDKIKQSQLFGPEVKPPPMALLGIAGKDVFLRGPNGQTGLIREGEELGGAKLIRIGTNRVLIEHEGRQQELMIFSGFGSETLLEKKEKP
jgi:hypothetical protein